MGQTSLSEVLQMIGWGGPPSQPSLFGEPDKPKKKDTALYYSGDLGILRRPSVAVVGSRDVTAEGAAAANKISTELVRLGIVVVSGLAKGVDFEAHQAAIRGGGDTVAVIGTPLDVAYPAAHRELQQQIAQEHLLLTPFEAGTRTFPSNFPRRNKVMAAVTSGTLVVEAGEGSGVIHQLIECSRLQRQIFLYRDIVDRGFDWPKQFLQSPRTHVVSSADDIVSVLLGQPK